MRFKEIRTTNESNVAADKYFCSRKLEDMKQNITKLWFSPRNHTLGLESESKNFLFPIAGLLKFCLAE